ncbi:MAG: bifunctional precorrin-2 dehydrogenase/sirohydrochlorin ferrochelatase [Actinomycetota bacterium]
MRPGLPVVLDVADRRCVVVGAGTGGRRKLLALLRAGASVTVVDPAGFDLDHPQDDGFDGIGPDAGIEVVARPWRAGDGADAFLVVVATDDPAVNEAVAEDAAAAGALVLRADRHDVGDLRLPAVTRGPNLTVAVDSGGGSPALAAVTRDEIARFLATERDRWDELARWAVDHRPVSVADVEARLAALRGRS